MFAFLHCLFLSAFLIPLIPARPQTKPLKEWKLSGPAQGSSFHMTYYAADSLVTRRSVDSLLAVIDASMSLYKPGSVISVFNQSAKGTPVDAHFARVISKALRIAAETDGAFDPTVYPLVKAWGFGPGGAKQAPADAALRNMLRFVGWKKISLRRNYLAKTAPEVSIDLNGIAQGYTVDLIADFIGKKGIANYMVEVGGELRINGKKVLQNQPFRIGIEAPDEDPFNPTVIQKVISPGGGAITTSGSYRQFRQSGSKKLSHLIDLKTGKPVDNNLLSVTVWAPDALSADGYDNALMAMGVKRSLAWLKNRKDLEAYFIYKKPNGDVADTATAGFYRLIKNTAHTITRI